ncbi:MAG: zinc ribbon domain-containing protein [Clostridia bacterium]|nr:zinc ribbon domain-containing protein [Clostridia bacterium]
MNRKAHHPIAFSGAFSLRLMAVLAVCVLAAVLALAEGGWVCPNCGRENIPEANFCGSCRTAKPVESAEVPNADVNAWVCSSCGRIAPSGDVFCVNCGQDHLATDAAAILRPAASLEAVSFAPANILRIPARTADGTLIRHYTAPVTGTFRFWIADQTADMEFKMRVKDSQGNVLTWEDFFKNRSARTLDCTEGSVYTIEVQNQSPSGSYTLCIGEARDVQPLGGCSVIRDSISFEDQRNRYQLIPEVTGLYRVTLSEAQNGFSVKPLLKDSLGYVLDSATFGMEMGGGISAELKAGETYFIEIAQRDSLGEYELTIGRPNPVIDLSGCGAFGDSVYYWEQENIYRFTAAKTGTYRFTMTQTSKGNEFNLKINNALGYQIESFRGMSEGAYRDVDLTAGETYQIVVQQRSGQGSYSMIISYP